MSPQIKPSPITESRLLALFAVVCIICAACSQGAQEPVATQQLEPEQPATTLGTTTTLATTTTERPETRFADLLSGNDEADVLADLATGDFTDTEIRARSEARSAIHLALEKEFEAVEACLAAVDDCDLVQLSQHYVGSLVVSSISEMQSLQGQGLQVARPDPDPSGRTIEAITFENDELTHAVVDHCDIEAVILTTGTEDNRTFVGEAVDVREGQMRVELILGSWFVSGVRTDDRNDPNASCAELVEL